MNLTTGIATTVNASLSKKIAARLDDLTKPPRSLGRLEEFALQYCLCRKSEEARITRSGMYVFAGDHGITAEGVAPYPKEVTTQMVHNMVAGGAAISVMCRNAGIDCTVVDMGVDADFTPAPGLHIAKVGRGTRSFLRESAMTNPECERAVAAGMSLAQSCEADLCGIGEMGIGNTSSASALCALLMGCDGAETVGRGAGAEGAVLDKKRHVIADAVTFHRREWNKTPLDALRRVGGYEVAGMVGFILGCAKKRIPVVVDGFIATTAALTVVKAAPVAKEYLFFGHASNEQFHRRVLSSLGVRPILDLDMRLGEGTGAALAMQIIAQAMNCYHQMATFSSAGVSGRHD
jgi:nicotinate-nucleotide--dimethylbenzimidazole phosphoribosyltransferase